MYEFVQATNTHFQEEFKKQMGPTPPPNSVFVLKAFVALVKLRLMLYYKTDEYGLLALGKNASGPKNYASADDSILPLGKLLTFMDKSFIVLCYNSPHYFSQHCAPCT